MESDTPRESRPGRNGGTLYPNSGRKPKGAISLTRRLEKALKEKIVDSETGKVSTNADLVIKSLIDQARGGNTVAQKLIFDRIDGLLQQRITIDISEIPDDRLVSILEDQAGSRSEA